MKWNWGIGIITASFGVAARIEPWLAGDLPGSYVASAILASVVLVPFVAWIYRNDQG